MSRIARNKWKCCKKRLRCNTFSCLKKLQKPDAFSTLYFENVLQVLKLVSCEILNTFFYYWYPIV